MKFTIIGLGIFGDTVARSLANLGEEVLAIDIDEQKIENIKDAVHKAICMDATNIELLKAQKVDSSDHVLVAIGENFEQLILCIAGLQEIGIKNIIARAGNDIERKIIQKLGITEIYTPEIIVGKDLAKNLQFSGHSNTYSISNEEIIIEINLPRHLMNTNVNNIKFEERYNIQLLSIKKGNSSIEINPFSVLTDENTLVLFGKNQDIKRFIEINK